MDVVRRAVTVVTSAALAAGVVLVGAAPARAAPTHDALVLQWYTDFLQRDGSTDAGHLYWTNQLDRGVQPSDVLWALLHSREYDELQITDDYRRYLGRAPDAGAAYWVDNTADHGMAVEWVAQNLLASAEYYQQNNTPGLGGRGQGVAAAWYADIVPPYDYTPADLAYWADRMRVVGVFSALREFWYSDQAVRDRINENYVTLLHRYAGYDELGYWYPKEVESDVNVTTLIGSTPEYASWAPTS